MNIKAPFTGNYYQLQIVTPVYIGGAKENDYVRGQDYFIENNSYIFIYKRALQKSLTVKEIGEYSQALIKNDVDKADLILKDKCSKDSSLMMSTCSCFDVPLNEIRAHIADANGNIYLPSSSLKGALRSILGVDLMRKTNQTSFENPANVFGNINNNFMRLIQLTDVTFERLKPNVIPSKILSGDIVGEYSASNYTGKGMWKNERIGGHNSEFKTSGFTTAYETIPIGSKGILRINFGDELLKFLSIQGITDIKNSKYLNEYSNNQWMSLAREHTSNFISKEKRFFRKFPNEDFSQAIAMWEDLEKHNQETNSVLLRIGSGTGYHGITGDWRYSDHTKTEQATKRSKEGLVNLDAITQKTRKVHFKSKDDMFFPGFVKLTMVTEDVYLSFQQSQLKVRVESQNLRLSDIKRKEIEEQAERNMILEQKLKIIEAKKQKDLEHHQLIQEAKQRLIEEEALYSNALTSTDIEFIKKYISDNLYKEDIDEVRRHLKTVMPAGLPERLISGNLTLDQFFKEAKRWKERNLDIFPQFEGNLIERFLDLAAGQNVDNSKHKIEELFSDPDALYTLLINK